MGIFSRAAQNLPLSPAQRAMLKLLGGIGFTALLAAAQVMVQVLNTQSLNGIDWAAVAHTAIATFAFTVLMALSKYYKAHGDPVLGAALDSEAQNVAAQNGLNAAKEPTGPVLDAVPAADDTTAPAAA